MKEQSFTNNKCFEEVRISLFYFIWTYFLILKFGQKFFLESLIRTELELEIVHDFFMYEFILFSFDCINIIA